jgi:RNA polymerase sigma factor (sigma-70 family)
MRHRHIEESTMIGSVFADVLVRARNAEQAAWDTIYRDLAGPLVGYFRSHRVADADDLAGETFLHVARGIATFSGDENQFRSWVFTIAHRRMIDAFRRSSRTPAASIDPEALVFLVDALNRSDDALDDVVDQLDRNGTLTALLGALTTDQAEVLVLRFGADLDATTVGELTGRSTNAVAAITARALQRLRELVEASPAGAAQR